MEKWQRNLFICTLACFIVSVGMSQMAPMLPLYIHSMGVDDPAEVARWSGIVFSLNFVSLAIFSPIWGRLSDRYGRKPMMLRATTWLGIIMIGMGLARNVYDLCALRLAQGALSGFLAATTPLISEQSPEKRAGWALSIFFTGQIAGSLIGPLIGGWMAETLGLRANFFMMAAFCFLGVVAQLFIHEDPHRKKGAASLSTREAFRSLEHPARLFGVFVTTFAVFFSLMSLQPVLTVYIAQLDPGSDHLALVSGAVFSSAGFASLLFASRLGKLSDRIGGRQVLFYSLLVAGLVSIPQAFVRHPWELGGLRFIHGIAAAGMMPAINYIIRQSVPTDMLGRIYGFNQSFQFVGMFAGAFLGGYIAATFGIRDLFLLSALLLFLSAGVCRLVVQKSGFSAHLYRFM